MFTGITQGLAEVTAVINKPNLMQYSVRFNKKMLQKLKIGASVAIDGVCQTVINIKDDIVTFNAIQNTLEITTLRFLTKGKTVSIERSARFSDEIGGHVVAGHVIGTALIIDLAKSLNQLTLTIQCKQAWLKYIFPKGFIAIDGSSLTIDKVNQHTNSFTIHLIPETLRITNFLHKKIGDLVNLEIDAKTRIIVDTIRRVELI
ncbi:MAG: riboflavin synthase subunit alpha [Legionellales bacterium RIFCSPHIGHO2_12_FULL_37_14]|nr:MAG: riboflavin synthase subunit alpha [Legionellales bacterium RIFCSPHIGHO2_12_FULL_37_14]